MAQAKARAVGSSVRRIRGSSMAKYSTQTRAVTLVLQESGREKREGVSASLARLARWPELAGGLS
jgi:hypothetical protein